MVGPTMFVRACVLWAFAIAKDLTSDDMGLLSGKAMVEDLASDDIGATGNDDMDLLVEKKVAEDVSNEEAGTVPLTWDDCSDSSYHGHITDLAPMQISLGTTTTLTGKGTLDEDVDGATFNFKAKTGPLTILKGSGNACEDTTIDLPFNSGNLVVHKVDCPHKAGDVIMKIDVTTKGKVADDSNSLVNINLQVAANNGDKLLCAHLTTQKAMVLMPEDPMRMCSNFVGSVAYNSTEYQCCGGEYGGGIVCHMTLQCCSATERGLEVGTACVIAGGASLMGPQYGGVSRCGSKPGQGILCLIQQMVLSTADVKCAGPWHHNLAGPPIGTPVQVPINCDGTSLWVRRESFLVLNAKLPLCCRLAALSS